MKKRSRQSAQSSPPPWSLNWRECKKKGQHHKHINLKLDHYSADCFVDATLMIAEETNVARGTFRDAQGREVLVHVPMQSFFRLHTLAPNAPDIWNSLCLFG